MNVFLWILQISLALHTVVGAVWKLSNSEQAVPSLAAIPHGMWLGLIPWELLCGLGLVLPALRAVPPLLAPIAAAGIAAEMLLFSGVHLSSGDAKHAPMIYWLVVAAVCALIVYGRLSLKPG
jgi:xanthine/uracil/vitamin C permease (AzgA family)